MEILKEEDYMNKKIFAGAIFMLCSTLTIAGCNATPSRQGNFDKKEYILSIDENHDFLQDLTLKGGQKSEVELVSSSQNIIDKTNGGVFVAKNSGSAIIEARIKGKTIASCKVVVKYKMALPKNFVFSQETGTLKWDKSFVTIDGEEVYANKYVVAYTEKVRPGGETNPITTSNSMVEVLGKNEYTFKQKGSYKVKISADRDGKFDPITGSTKPDGQNDDEMSKYIDNSDFCQEFEVNFGSMGEIENFKVENSTDFTEETATLVWGEKANAVYDIYIEGFLIKENLDNANYELDYSANGISVREGQTIEIKIVAKDKDGFAEASETIKTITRLSKPVLSYLNSDENLTSGHIALEKANANDEIVYVVKDKDGKLLSSATDISNVLDGFSSGIYKIQAFAKANERGLNSSLTDVVSFAKLSSPVVDMKIENNSAILTFEGAPYVKRYKLECEGHTQIISLEEGENIYSLSLAPFNLSSGDHSIKITALPTIVDGQIKEYTSGGESTANVINSTATECSFKVLNELGEINHYIEEGANKFKFNHILGATDYIVEVNGHVLNENKFSIDANGDKTILSLPTLKNIEPNANNSYVIKITAIRQENGKITGVESSAIKEIKLLSVVSASETQTNGAFAFNKADETDTYYYEIFRTGKDYTLPNDAMPIFTNTIYSGNKTTENLTGGYYKIRIYTKSSDENQYLDADFADPSRYFEADFAVSQKIDTPTITYDKNTGSLLLQRVQFGGGYEIYVDGVLNGRLDLADDDADAIYTFPAGTFADAKTYSVAVKAVGGTKYGNEIYEDSALANISITKLSTPSFTVVENFDAFGKKTGETLTVASESNAKAVKYFVNGQELEDNGYSIELFKPERGVNFDFKVGYIARDEGLNSYYIDSDILEKTFERIDAPKNMEYRGGKITFVGSEKATDYYATLYLIGENGTTYYKGLPLNSTDTEMDLQARLNLLMLAYPALATAYENANYYEIELYSVINDAQAEGENYLLSSFNGTSISGGQKLVLNKLSASELTFDKASKTLSWTQVEEGSTYDIYANGVPVLTGLTSLSTSLNNDALRSLNLLDGATIKIKSNNEKYLGSKFSNEIFIKKLASAKEVSLSSEGKVTILLPDATNTLKVLNNGDEMSYSIGETSVTKILDGDEEFNISFVGKDSENKYYLDSDINKFSFKEFAKPILTKKENKLSWQDLSLGQNGISENKLIYTVCVASGNDKWEYKLLTNEISITDIQSLLNISLLAGQTSISVKASLSGGYSLSAYGVGYYGESQSDTLSITKLATIQGEASVIYENEGNAFEQKSESKVKIVFADIWAGISDVKFKINNFILSNGTYLPAVQNEVVLGAGDKTSVMALAKEGDNYILTIDQNYYASAGKYETRFSVISEGYIESDTCAVEVSRLSQVTSLKMSEKGEIVLNDNNNFVAGSNIYNANIKYLVMLTINGQKEVKLVQRGVEFSANDFSIWKNGYGDYTLDAICYDDEGKVMPSSQIFTITGTKLQGIESLKVDENGNLIAVVSENKDIVFTGKVDGVEKTLNLTSTERTNEFSISLIEIADVFNLSIDGEYQIDLTVRKNGSVDADWKSAKFAIGTQDKYYLVKSENTEKTYLVIEKKDELSKKFRLNINGEILTISTAGIPFLLPIKQGYVNYTLDGGSKTNMTFSQSKGDNYFLCYAMELDACLNLTQIEYGDFDFKISRISEENGFVKQNNEKKVSVVKLNPIETEATATDYLQVKDSILRFGFTNKTSRKNVAVLYVVDFAYNDGANHYKKYITTKSLDLRTIGLTEGVEYTISVKVACKTDNMISSNSAGEVKTIKYTSPTSLDVKNGALKFNDETFKSSPLALKAIAYAKGELTEQKFIEFISQTIFTQPYYFSAIGENVGLGDGVGKLTFAKLNNGNITGEEYTVSIALKNLIPDFEIDNANLGEDVTKTFFGVMEYLANSTAVTQTEQVQKFLDDLTKSNKGIGLGDILFDDIGRAIPAGDYRVTVCQLGGESGNVDSVYASSTQIKINPAPAIGLIYDSDTNLYKANIAPQGGAENFALHIRQNGKTVAPSIYVSLNGASKWVALCDGKDISEILGEYTSGFSLSLNSIRKVLKEKDIIVLQTEAELDCDIFENSENSLSKSGKFTLCYRELKGENISFNNGEISLGENHSLTDKILLRYQQKGLMQQQKTFTGKVSLPYIGEYDYFILSFPGEIISNKVYIESARYMIKEAFQLNAPVVSTAENIFNIKLATSDLAYSGDMTLSITNNMANNNYTYINGLDKFENLATNGISYQPGKADGETRANKFTFALQGNSAAFSSPQALEGEEAQKAEYILNHTSQQTLVFSSAEKSYDAKMLNGVKLSIVEGNLKWTECSAQTDGTVLYEVKIDYYSTSSSDTDTTPKQPQILYTSSTSLSTDLLLDTLDKFDYTYYNVSVSPIVGQKADSSQEGTIQTVDGEFYSIKNESRFNDRTVVLKGISVERKSVRAKAVTGVKIKDGKINFKLNSGGFLIDAKRDGKTYRLEGDTSINSKTKETIFTPFTGEQLNGLEEGYTYNLTIYAYEPDAEKLDGGGALLSKPYEINEVYKLPEISENRYEIVFKKDTNNNYATVLDLSKYFTSSVNGDRTCYKVAVAYSTPNQENVFETLTPEKSSIIIDNWTSLEMVSMATETTSKNLINSTAVNFDISATTIYNNRGECQLSPSFDPDAQRFNWKWLDNREGEFEYYVELTYADKSKEIATVKTKYYFPVGMGTIESFKISARHCDEDVKKYTFSRTYTVEGTFKLDMFQRGNGTISNPYVIASKDQFLNIASRNDAKGNVYFMLEQNLILKQSELSSNGQFLIKGFNGTLDGNGKTITLICDQELSINAISILVGNSSTPYTISKGCALFESISQTGTVKNLFIETSLQFANAPQTSVISPLTLVNYGKITNVTSQNFEMAQNAVLSSGNAMFVSGIVGVNRGEISQCTNSTALNIQIKQTSFAYAGISLTNEKRIEKCTVLNSKSFTLLSKGTNIHLGGIVLTNLINGAISLCGVESSFTVNATANSNVYGGGLVEKQIAGSINACYFNGEFAKTPAGTLSAGGIIYSISGGSINNTVCASTTLKFEGTDIASSITIENCFGSSSSRTLKALSAQTNILSGVSGFNGVILAIEYSDATGSYKAKLTY